MPRLLGNLSRRDRRIDNKTQTRFLKPEWVNYVNVFLLLNMNGFILLNVNELFCWMWTSFFLLNVNEFILLNLNELFCWMWTFFCFVECEWIYFVEFEWIILLNMNVFIILLNVNEFILLNVNELFLLNFATFEQPYQCTTFWNVINWICTTLYPGFIKHLPK